MYLDGNEFCTYLLLYLGCYYFSFVTMSFPPLFFKRNELKKKWYVHNILCIQGYYFGGRRPCRIMYVDSGTLLLSRD